MILSFLEKLENALLDAGVYIDGQVRFIPGKEQRFRDKRFPYKRKNCYVKIFPDSIGGFFWRPSTTSS